MSACEAISIYIHIPFCTTKCTYCAFNTYTNQESLIQPFTEAVARELRIVGSSAPGTPAHTVFFGGGTPSLLTPRQLDAILQAVTDSFVLAAGAEISLEANPNDLDRDYLAALRSLGINRLSIGMQSAVPSELALFARRHDNDAVVRAVSAARAAGFDNINLDLIYGVPHQTLDNWATSLNQMLALQPEHVSLYALGLEDGTPMKRWVERGQLPAPDDDLSADMYELATERLTAAGYEQYEISNWSKPGRACRHNLQYWYNLPYIGVGPGAHGFAGGIRYSTILNPQRYIRALQNDAADCPFPLTPAVAEWTALDQRGEIAETLIMSLRLTRQGVERAAFARRFGVDLLDVHGETIERFARFGLLSVDDERVRLTERGRLLSNVIFRELV
ncbi:MAG: radical SAM family heme chaperone HemW [Chloroflexota bacterium]|nr:MAG: coproporphyrinogen III oxidase [Chloroflexota bacterium]